MTRTYRGFEITHDYEWVAVHPDYDFDEDNRIFHDQEIEDLHDQINDWIEEQALSILADVVRDWDASNDRAKIPPRYVSNARALLKLDAPIEVAAVTAPFKAVADVFAKARGEMK